MRYILFILCLTIIGCTKKKVDSFCGTLYCPPTTNVIYLSVVDENGKPTKALYIETYNTRTRKRQINLQDPPNYFGGESYKYKLFFNTLDFSFEGDYVIVLVKSESGKEFNLSYVVKGGKCTCDVEKVSGPDLLKIDK